MRRDLNLNTVTLWAMWETVNIEYVISYNTNGGTPSSIEPTRGVASPLSSIILTSTTPTLPSYTFEGWCDKSNISDKTNCSGGIYGAGSSFALSKGSIITLYATYTWGPPESCNNSLGKRLKDGKCWMTYNYGSSDWWVYTQDICKNISSSTGSWRNPTKSDFNSLIRAYFPSATYSSCGYSYEGDTTSLVNDWGAQGTWWSNDIDDSCGAHYLYVGTGVVSSAYADKVNSSKRAVRCVSN